MSIELVTGVPGSGKTSHVIRMLSTAQETGQQTHLFLCGDSRELQKSPSISLHQRISSRDGRTWPIDYFESTPLTIEIVERLAVQPPAIFVFEEAQYFGSSMIESWKALSDQEH